MTEIPTAFRYNPQQTNIYDDWFISSNYKHEPDRQSLLKDKSETISISDALRYLHPGQPLAFTETVWQLMIKAQQINGGPFLGSGNEAERLANPSIYQEADILRLWLEHYKNDFLSPRSESPNYEYEEQIAKTVLDQIYNVALNGDYQMVNLQPDLFISSLRERITHQMEIFETGYYSKSDGNRTIVRVGEWEKLYSPPRLDVWIETQANEDSKLTHPVFPDLVKNEFKYYEWRIDLCRPKENPNIELVILSGGAVDTNEKFHPNLFQAYSQIAHDEAGFLVQKRQGPYLMERQNAMRVIMDPRHDRINLPKIKPYDMADNLSPALRQAIEDKRWDIATCDRLMVLLVRSWRKLAFLTQEAPTGSIAAEFWDNFPPGSLSDYHQMVNALAYQFNLGHKITPAGIMEMNKELMILNALTPNFFHQLAKKTGFYSLFPRTTGLESQTSPNAYADDCTVYSNIVTPIKPMNSDKHWESMNQKYPPLIGIISYARCAGIEIPDISTAAKIPWLFTPKSELEI
jgi:hypothetical protein